MNNDKQKRYCEAGNYCGHHIMGSHTRNNNYNLRDVGLMNKDNDEFEDKFSLMVSN